jgi:hypothetical protein
MPPVDAVELAALAAAFGPVLIDSRGPLPREAMHRYWSASRCRANHWCREMKRRTAKDAGAARKLWSATRPIIEEIVVTEVLTRTWGAVLAAIDQRRGEREAEPIGRSALSAHLDARTRAMTLLLQGSGIPASGAVRINRLRKQAERWSDMFVAFVSGRYRIAAYSCRPQRMRQFAADFAGDARWKPGQTAWRLLRASLRRGFSTVKLSPGVSRGDLAAEVAGSILECFDPLVLDANLHFPNFWLTRLEGLADSTEDMIGQLAGLEEVAAR